MHWRGRQVTRPLPAAERREIQSRLYRVDKPAAPRSSTNHHKSPSAAVATARATTAAQRAASLALSPSAIAAAKVKARAKAEAALWVHGAASTEATTHGSSGMGTGAAGVSAAGAAAGDRQQRAAKTSRLTASNLHGRPADRASAWLSRNGDEMPQQEGESAAHQRAPRTCSLRGGIRPLPLTAGSTFTTPRRVRRSGSFRLAARFSSGKSCRLNRRRKT